MTTAPVFCATLLAAASAACGPAPPIAHAHQLERAASWASAVAFATTLRSEGDVPQHYVDDLVSAATRGVKSVRAQVAGENDVDSSSRAAAIDALDDLAAALSGSIDPRRIGAAELRVRTLALQARARAGAAQ